MVINMSGGNPSGVAQYYQGLSVVNAIFAAEAQRRKEKKQNTKKKTRAPSVQIPGAFNPGGVKYQ
ncbi:MAG TPA: hypothetical protein PLX35_05080 [Cyclobacteriaceae bacterium]|nr:hypothetical protein [Cyclobacteriaceae bacterium]